MFNVENYRMVSVLIVEFRMVEMLRWTTTIVTFETDIYTISMLGSSKTFRTFIFVNENILDILIYKFWGRMTASLIH